MQRTHLIVRETTPSRLCEPIPRLRITLLVEEGRLDLLITMQIQLYDLREAQRIYDRLNHADAESIVQAFTWVRGEKTVR